ncbi:hypothetical protein [Brenneria izadpanahii]|uniref:hypothetical protein n=1 Tax=Brenneria izadpanahii TaxID=2722756 RepID=UPI001AAF7945|nr:hypothetical protein [Brenneria izadpanahii]
MKLNRLTGILGSLLGQANGLAASAPSGVSAPDSSRVTEIILSMGYIYGIETGYVYLVPVRTETQQ